jgi:Conserved TM helix
MAAPTKAIDFQGGISDAWTTVATFVPKLVFFFVVLIVGFIIAKILSKAVAKILERVGFDKAVERGGVKKALEESEYDPSDIVGKLVKYAVILFTLVIAFNVFGPNPISDLLEQVIAFLPSVIVAIVIIVVAAAIAAAVKELITNTLGGLSYGKVLAGIAAAFILFLGVIAALGQVGVATTVTTPVLVTILATIGGVIVVGAGGGLIKPMQARWERYLSTAEAEAPKIKEHAKNAPSVKEQAQQAKAKAKGSAQETAQHDGRATEPVGSRRL